MRLCEHPDFDQAIQRTAMHFQARGLRPAIVEKDYYVTEALREIAAAAGVIDQVDRTVLESSFARGVLCARSAGISPRDA